jgi:hypothetical protein
LAAWEEAAEEIIFEGVKFYDDALAVPQNCDK